MQKISKRQTINKQEHYKDEPIRVLHVDDDVGLLSSTRQILELHGLFVVDSVGSVEKAYEFLENSKYDVVVSDYKMSNKSGLEFLRELKETGNEIPFILLTGKGREEIAIRALNLGANFFINKFGNPETVYTELSHAIIQLVNQVNTRTALDNERKLLELVTKNLSVGLAIVSKDYKLLWVNNVLKDVLGDDYKGRVCYSLINGRKSPCPKCGVKQLFENRNSEVVHEQLIKMSNGQNVWLEIVTTPIKDSKGKLTAALELVSNISERKEMETELHDNIRKYRQLVENSLQGIMVIHDTPIRIVFANKAMGDILGYSFEEFSSFSQKEVIELINIEDRSVVLEHFRKRLQKEETVCRYNFRMIKKNGDLCWVEMIATCIVYNGEPAIQASFMDITELKNSEFEMSEICKQLK